jgi:ubiquinone/menaquinone biosynthesis C-methylase UbiE
MSITTNMQSQGGKPSGMMGTLIGYLMNMFHGNIHAWGLHDISLPENAACLDIGCGGGNTVKALAEKASSGRVHGLDHSAEMVTLSRRLNRAVIAQGVVEIHQGSVSALPFSDDSFDLVTAFETIQFWPDIQHDVMEVKRILKPSGSFLIVNRYPPENSKWSDFLQLKNANAYKGMLCAAGFQDIALDTTTKSGWIKVVAHA